MGSAEVIAHYEALLALTDQMIEAARQEEWDTLTQVERARGELVLRLKTIDAGTVIDAATRQRKRQLIDAVLTYDAEIRERVRHWMSEHDLDMQSTVQEQRLLREYGA